MNNCFEINSESELSQFRDQWQALLSVTPHASFLSSSDWLKVRWKHASDGEDHFVIVVKSGSEIIGFVPLVIAPMKTSLGKILVAQFPLDGWGSFYGPVSKQPNETLGAAVEHLLKSKRKFDLLELSSLPCFDDASPHVEHDSKLSTIEILGRQCVEDSRVGQIDLEHDWESYWQSRRKQKNRRRNVERCERRLNELGTVRWERFRPEVADHSREPDYRLDLLEACERISKISWQKDLVNGNTIHHDDVNPLLRDAYEEGVRNGAIDISLLFLDDVAIAYAFGYHFQGYVDLYRIGFDPEYSKYAPGNALWSRIIEDSFKRGDRVLDLGPTCLDYKRFWITRLEPSYKYSRFLSIKAKALQAARKLKCLRESEIPIVETNSGNRMLALKKKASQ